MTVNYDRATVIESLVQTALPGKTKFYVDPLKHLRTQHYESSDLEDSTAWFFMLHNLDYQNWISKAGVQMLVYKSFPCLPHAVPHLVRILRSTEESCLQLHFSPDRVEQSELAQTSKSDKCTISVVVSTFFCQAIETCPQEQRQSFLQGFLHILLTSLTDKELIEIQKSPKSKFNNIIECSKPDTLWTALEGVLLRVADLCIYPGLNGKLAKPSLKIILDLSRAKDEWEEIIQKLRLVIQRLRLGFSTIKLLITDPPDTVGIPLLQPCEVLVSYDQERQGIYDGSSTLSHIRWTCRANVHCYRVSGDTLFQEPPIR